MLAQRERERSFRKAGCPVAAITTVVNVYWVELVLPTVLGFEASRPKHYRSGGLKLRRLFSATSGAGSPRSGVPGLRSLHRLWRRVPPASSSPWGPQAPGQPSSRLPLSLLPPPSVALCLPSCEDTPLGIQDPHSIQRSHSGVQGGHGLGVTIDQPTTDTPPAVHGRSGCHPQFINRK